MNNSFKVYERYKDFLIFKKDGILTNEFFGCKLTQDKKEYEFRTKDFKNVTYVKKSIDRYISKDMKKS